MTSVLSRPPLRSITKNLLGVDPEEYGRMPERLEEAEAFRKKVAITAGAGCGDSASWFPEPASGQSER